MIDAIFELSADIRYVAVYRDGHLERRSRSGLTDASSNESDRYEELLVNPTLIKLAAQRGDIDCGGLDYIVVKYGKFHQYVLPLSGGHVSVCIAAEADPIRIGHDIRRLVRRIGG